MDVSAPLQQLCATPGVSGHEARIREAVKQLWQPLTHEQHTDPLGSLWATRYSVPPPPLKKDKDRSKKAPAAPKRPKIMLAAHIDTIGLMVTHVEGDFLRVTSIGGIDARVMPGQLVTVHGKEDLPGLVVLPATFLLAKEHRDSVPPVTELLVDTGLAADDLAQTVRIGDVISFAQPPVQLQGDYLASPYMDNRASVLAVTACLDELQHRPHQWDVVAVATVQEENTLGGAYTSAFAIQPDLAIAIDVTHGIGAGSKDYPDKTFALNNGPVLGYGPNIHTGLFKALKATAEGLELDYAIEVMTSQSGTDAYALQVAREGIPTAVIGIPLRNMHSPIETLHLKDLTRVGRLLATFIADLPLNFMDTLSVD